MNAEGQPVSLSDAAARVLIARRLISLDHPPDYLTPEAVDLLLLHGAASGSKLRTALASVLFLASTEDAPKIDVATASRALGDAPAPPPPPPPPPPSLPARQRATGALFGAGLMLCMGLAAFLIRPRPDPPTLLASVKLGRLADPLVAPAPAMLVAAPPLPALPPDVAVGTLPVPPGAPFLPLQTPALPASANPMVVLLFSARLPHSLDQLATLQQALQRAGITDIRTRPVAVPRARRAISYFYADDARLAQTIADAVASTHWAPADSNSLRPLLVLIPSGLPARMPGEVDVQLP